MMETGSNRSN